MSSKKSLAKEIRKEILSCDCDYDYVYDSLKENFKETSSGIFNSFLYLFRRVDNINNERIMDNLIKLLTNFVSKNKNKKLLNDLFDRIQIFLGNLSKSLDYDELKKLEKYITQLVNIQNKCLANSLKKSNSEKYYFMVYLIFQTRDIELLHKYMLDNMKELLRNNTILPAVLMNVIEKFINLEEENVIEINYYNQVINLFLKGKLVEKIFNGNNEFMQILKSSKKSFVWELIDRIENDFLITKEKLAKLYSVSFKFPDDLEEIKYTFDGRVDYTNQDIITIDSDDDVCLDDALYLEKNKNGTYTIYIHLASPSSIISYNSKTMQEALKRGETIYTIDGEIPIFKENLSNNILSILPGKKTNTTTFIVTVDTDFTVLLDTVRIVPSVVINKHRLSYDSVDEMLRRNDGSELTEKVLLLSKIFNKLSRNNLQIRTFHKLQNFILNNNGTNSAKADISSSHELVENSMVFVNTLPHILNVYHNLGLIFPYRVQPPYTDVNIGLILSDINKINSSDQKLKNIIREYLTTARYSDKNIGHSGLGLSGYVRISSSARRALDNLAQYILHDLYLNRGNGDDLDQKYYFWEKEIKYWCYYTNNRIAENNNFLNEYNYLFSKRKLLTKEDEKK